MNPQLISHPTLANWRAAPFNRWAFHHVRELIPTADIPNDPRRVRELPVEKQDLDLRIEPDAGEAMGMDAFLRETDTDGMAILHRGRLVFERHANGLSEEAPHIFMSVSKSMLGLLIHEIGLDTGRRVAEIVPQVKGTAYREARVRDLLDMRAGIVWNEDYLATSGPIVEYRKATGWNPLGAGETPSDLKSFYANLQQTAPHNGPVHYVSPNSDLLGWVVENATGERYATVMSTMVWKKAGAERSAYITVDRLGAPRCAGGMCSTLRDLARVGQWLIEERQSFLQEVETGGDPKAWSGGDLAQVFRGLPMRYRSQWYVLEGEAPLVFGWGIHGQHLFIDRKNQIVIARFASQSLPVDAARIALLLRAVSEIRKRFS
jgi:CubicO group peptidase (beta-lactamase class C family)